MESFRNKVISIAEQVPKTQINPSDDFIKQSIQNKFLKNTGNHLIIRTKITSRSAAFTEIIGQGDDSPKYKELEKLIQFVNPSDLIVMKLKIGQPKGVLLKAVSIIHKDYANKSLMLRRNFYESDHSISESDIISFDIPTYPVRKVIVDPSERVTYVMGIDYYGEQKMSLLRMAMEIMRRDNGGLGLHAGSKMYQLSNGNGSLHYKGMLIFGLSGTGKTTLTCHDHGFQSPETVKILQDDINLITKDGKAMGSEFGYYVKTDQCPEHPLITKAVLSDGTVMENVAVNSEGEIEWKDFSHTYNGRAIVPRYALDRSADDIDLPNLDVILFNTRRPELPPIGRLVSPAQGAAYYGLGESVITSAEDPAKAGQSKRVVGFDPFILGEESLNINRIKLILSTNPNIKCYLVNTGYVGMEENDIGVSDTLACIEAMLREKISWKMDEDLGYEVPEDVPNVDWEKFIPQKFYGKEKYNEIMKDLRNERKAHLSQYAGIDKDIIDSI